MPRPGCSSSRSWASTWRTCGRRDGASSRTEAPRARASRSTSASRSPRGPSGVAAYSVSALIFWRILAYLAVFHFVRQQYGWVALYRRKNGEGKDGRLLDAAAIYGATLTPLLFWHAHLPRRFQWFLRGRLRERPARGRQHGRVRPLCRDLRRVDREGGRACARRPARVVGEGPDRPLDGGDVVPGHRRLRLRLRVHGDERLRPRHSVHGPRVVHVEIARRGAPRRGRAPRPSRTGWRRSSSSSSRLFSSSRSPRNGAGTASSGTTTPCSFRGLRSSPARSLLALIVPLLALPQATHYVWDAFLWKVRPENRGTVEALGIR